MWFIFWHADSVAEVPPDYRLQFHHTTYLKLVSYWLVFPYAAVSSREMSIFQLAGCHKKILCRPTGWKFKKRGQNLIFQKGFQNLFKELSVINFKIPIQGKMVYCWFMSMLLLPWKQRVWKLVILTSSSDAWLRHIWTWMCSSSHHWSGPAPMSNSPLDVLLIRSCYRTFSLKLMIREHRFSYHLKWRTFFPWLS